MPDNAHQVLILRDEMQTLWQGKDVFAEVQQLHGEVARAAPGRQTLRFELAGRAYYRKLHTGVGWGEIIKNLIRLRLPVIGARNEWLALNKLAELKVPSLTPVAYGEQKTNPATRLSFIVTRELCGTVQLDHYLLERLQARTLRFAEKRVLLQQTARIARVLHANGINHRDLYLCHFLLDRQSIVAWLQGQGEPILYLVDLHRAQLRARVPRRWQVKDIGSLYFSALDFGVTRGDVYRFLQHYFGQSLREIIEHHSALLREIEQRAHALYAREQRLKQRVKQRRGES